MSDINTVIESYADYLSKTRKGLWKQFQKRRRDNPESALAEAVVFDLLKGCGVSPEVADIPNKGGPDFRCIGSKTGPFMVEATSFQVDKVTKDTGIGDGLSAGITAQAFSMLDRQVEEKAGQKLEQGQFQNQIGRASCRERVSNCV